MPSAAFQAARRSTCERQALHRADSERVAPVAGRSCQTLGGMPETMPIIIELETPRLRLRQWRASDRAPFAAMNGDPAVMKFFASIQSSEASNSSIDGWQSQFAERGWSNWAVELRSSGAFIGFVGLSVPRRLLPCSPCVEVGWRLARSHWGQGYATEGARAALRVGFGRLALAEIVSFTSVLNLPSRAVMERIGMRNAQQDFEHPGVPEHHRLRLHCLYRITHAQWRANAA
jgi:RimJ/RimL family protein N-acetyltransferase